MNVSNGKCIRDLSRKSLRANRTRNLIAVLAIPAAVLFGLIYLVWTVSDAVTGRLEHRTDYL